MTDEFAGLLDREKIRDCIARVARGEDRRDPGLLTGGFWADAHVEMGIFSGGFDEYLAWVVPGSPAVELTQHFLGQSLIEIRDHDAAVETHLMSYHRILAESGPHDVTIGGRYLDLMRRRDGQWRIMRRTLLYDWLHDGGASVNWSGGVLGAPLLDGRHTGRAAGDHSETFFGAGRGR